MIRLLFHYLSLLNIFDACMTYYGLENALITEVNPIMDRVYENNPAIFFAIKLSLSIFLYLFIIFNRVPSSRLVQGVTVIASLLYTVVFALHCWWLLLAFYG